MLKQLLNTSLALILIALSFSPAVSPALSQAPTEQSGASYNDLVNRLNENIRKQNDLRQKIADAQNQQNTLAGEIENLENQIQLTILEIEETQNRLEQLESDIGGVSQQLEETKNELNYSTEVANSRIKQLYQQGFVEPAEAFISSDNFNDYLIRKVYTEAVRNQDIALLESLKETKEEFTKQKQDLEDKKSRQESLKSQMEEKRATLVGQNNEKQYLLGATKNQEENYQRLLVQVQIELESIARALGGGAVRLGPVSRGDVVAFQGNTGCSTGTHLHFGLYKNGVAVNPKPYLDSGFLRWPENGPTVTQWYGANFSWYMRNFGLPGHNGIDMTSGFGSPIYAARGGIAYAASDSQACWLTGTVGKGVVIDHGGGFKTIYWHIK